MTALTLNNASAIAGAAIAAGQQHGFAPLCAVVLDAGGRDLVVMRSERAAHYRADIARAKAAGCIGMGMGGRAIAERAKAAPGFYAALPALVGGAMLPVPGGVLIRNALGHIVGAVGISGDTSDHDETAALAGIAAAGLAPDTGQRII